ncbi:MAG: TlyA family RNA methyltransferase [Deltaproteobacteria bacterium]|nr:TlyA family RNA methyltransferase [Deltaproteobacteria bacterium]
MVKERLDVLMFKKGLVPSREKAKILILAGEVYVSGERVTTPDKRYDESVDIEIKLNPIPYVSFGGVKLEKAIREFHLDVREKVAVDVGASTGGFTDCLLKFGASHVYAIDVGKNQLHYLLRSNPRVTLIEGFNARYLKFETIGTLVDIATVDVSFISLKKILPNLVEVVKPKGHILTLVKPQFEVGRFEVGKGGIVKDSEKIKKVIEDIKSFGSSLNIHPKDVLVAPKENQKKNTEYFILWEK